MNKILFVLFFMVCFSGCSVLCKDGTQSGPTVSTKKKCTHDLMMRRRFPATYRYRCR